MNEHPLICSQPMIPPILDLRKTETRRLLKEALPIGVKWWQVFDGELNYRIVDSKTVLTHCKCPFGKVGDILWVRETFNTPWLYDGAERDYYYKASDSEMSRHIIGTHWKPSIFMPRKAARIFLEITEILVERLQDITEEGAISEGIQKISNHNQWFNYLDKTNIPANMWVRGAVQSYRTLWINLHGVKSWDANPWVWVIKFKKK